jgi:hypothetical protein
MMYPSSVDHCAMPPRAKGVPPPNLMVPPHFYHSLNHSLPPYGSFPFVENSVPLKFDPYAMNSAPLSRPSPTFAQVKPPSSGSSADKDDNAPALTPRTGGKKRRDDASREVSSYYVYFFECVVFHHCCILYLHMFIQKHNETERKRLQKLNDRIMDIKNMMNLLGKPTKESKMEILQGAVELLVTLHGDLLGANRANLVLMNEISALRSLASISKSKVTSSAVSSSATQKIDYDKLNINNMIPTLISTQSGTILESNTLFATLLEFKVGDLAGKNMDEILAPLMISGQSKSAFQYIIHVNPVQPLEMVLMLMTKSKKNIHVSLRVFLVNETPATPYIIYSVLPRMRPAAVGVTRVILNSLSDANFDSIAEDFSF